MNILIVGSGGREHVLAWKIAQSPLADKIYCAPGNAGIEQVAECVNIGVDELEKLADFAEQKAIDFTVAGPEDPLCDGIVNVFRKRGLKIFGPDKYAAQLEGSKNFAKNFMRKYNIPCAESETFSDLDQACDYVSKQFAAGKKALVIKADGTAAGKGVLVSENEKEALDFVRGCISGTLFGKAGTKILIEECLFGEEASILALCDGKNITALASSQDHKRAFDGDMGLNTGGMGSYSPAPVVDPAMMDEIQQNILDNFLRGVQEENLDFKGLIFVGIMFTGTGPKVLEFNVRFGDPEVQSVMSRLDSDLLEALIKTSEGQLAEVELKWSDDAAVCVVLASGGYPGSYEKGLEISGIDEAEKTGAQVFHAGTAKNNEKIVNNGGRVLGVTARGKNIAEAIDNAYRAADKISWRDCFCRRDIGHRALAKIN